MYYSAGAAARFRHALAFPWDSVNEALCLVRESNSELSQGHHIKFSVHAVSREIFPEKENHLNDLALLRFKWSHLLTTSKI